MYFKFQKELVQVFTILHNLCDERVQIYLVGGFLRDFFLGKESKDLDFVIYPFSYEILENFTKIIRGKIFPLDEKRKYFRVVANLQSNNYVFDFTSLTRANLLEEVKRRDFTINAIFLDLNNFRILDPLNGIQDIKEGKLRVCSKYSISEDPLRILRAFRFVSNLGFKIIPDTEKHLIVNKKKLGKIKGERIHDEIYRILKGAFTKEIWFKMHDLSILEEILPELTSLKDIPWNKPHHTNPLFHSLEALGKLEYIYYYLDQIFPEKQKIIKDYLKEEVYSEFTKKELLKLAILLHDIGKEKAFSIDEEGKVHYYGHENVGVLIIENISERLRFSKKEKELLKKLIKFHLYPAFILKDKKANRFKLLNKLKEETIGTILLFLGDQLSIKPVEEIISFSHEILDLYLEKKEIKPIISGDEIMKYFSLKPSPLIGRLKGVLLQAQQEGLVNSKEDALKFLENVLKNEGDR
ncbi:MAG: HD domain-containing protein [Dictyoglomaceae bacterium]